MKKIFLLCALVCAGQLYGMEPKKLTTYLSSKEEAALRKAIIKYKNNKSRSEQEKIINRYKNKYPNDPLVKAKLNEKARFDSSIQPQKIKQNKQQSKKEYNKVSKEQPKGKKPSQQKTSSRPAQMTQQQLLQNKLMKGISALDIESVREALNAGAKVDGIDGKVAFKVSEVRDNIYRWSEIYEEEEEIKALEVIRHLLLDALNKRSK